MGDAGFESREEDLVQVVVRRLDATSGAEVWRRAYDHGDRKSMGIAATLDGDSRIVAGWQEVGEGKNEASVQRWGADGTLCSTWTRAAPGALNTRSDAVAVVPGGTIVLSTHAHTSNVLEGAHLVGFAGDGTVQWTTRVETDWSFPTLRSLAVDDTGRLFATGSAEVTHARLKGMLGLFNADGAALKLEIRGGEEILSGFSSIAVHPSGFAVAGILCDHTTCDQWVRKYAPL